MKRRTFLGNVSAALAGATLAPASAAVVHEKRFHRLTRIGLELYAVRGAMQKDPEGTLIGIHEMGYTDVELLWSHNNFGRSTEQVRASLVRAGLRAPSAHIAPEILTKNWDRSLATAKTLGHDYLIVPSLPAETQHSLDAWRRWADRFNQAGEAARKAGVWLAFHNEPDHMKPIAGEVPYDVFVARTQPDLVRLQLDVGNMAVGGGDPFAYLERHRARYWSFHIKDVVADNSRDTELGTGRLDFKRLLSSIPDLDQKPCYVEQEGPAQEVDSARKNLAYLSALEF
jgi:sugar phosphate isomerase/epimerase